MPTGRLRTSSTSTRQRHCKSVVAFYPKNISISIDSHNIDFVALICPTYYPLILEPNIIQHVQLRLR